MHSIEMIHKKLISLLGSVDHKSVLDYGCGKGGLIKLLLQQPVPPQFIYAVDSNETTINTIQKIYANEIQQGSIGTQIVNDPSRLSIQKFDRVICHNVLECIENKEQFVKNLYKALNDYGTLVVSHHDFDSAIYHSDYRDLTRSLIHFFSDKGEPWQPLCDGQIGRKIPGVFKRAGIENVLFETWRIVETSFKEGDYGFLMAKMIVEVAKGNFDQNSLDDWMRNLESKAQAHDFYFAIDVVIARASKS